MESSKTSSACIQLQSMAARPLLSSLSRSAGEKALAEKGFNMTAPRGNPLTL